MQIRLAVLHAKQVVIPKAHQVLGQPGPKRPNVLKTTTKAV